MSERRVPDYAHTVLVPIANPATAPILLELGAKLTHPEDGQLIALFVSLGEAETETKQVALIAPYIDEMQAAGYAARFMTHVSTSVARGILDVAREEGADLLVLGLRQPTAGRVILGSVVESVAAIAPCDMLLYRAAKQAAFERVVVPVDGSLHAAVACRMGILLGEGYQTPVEAVHVQESYRPHWEGRGRIEQSLADLPGQSTVKRTLITAQDAASGLLSRTGEDDLIIVGVSERSTLERWLFGDFSGRVLSNASGPVILIKRSTLQNGGLGLWSRLVSRITLTLTQTEKDEIMWQAEEMASPTLDYLVLIAISAILASLGLLLNSVAVIIGAMLVAPLMQPLIGLASGVATGRIRLVWRAAGTLVRGVFFALLVSAAVGVLIPLELPTGEMLARGNPSLLDAGVALASGLIGAYATARKDIPAALAGVAIAAALMPPLCTVGLGLGTGHFDLSLHASLLFLANTVCISLAAWLVFFWVGIRPRSTSASRRSWSVSIVLVVALLLPVIAALAYTSNRESQEVVAERFLQQRFLPAEVVDVVLQPGEPLGVVATVRATDDLAPAYVQGIQAELVDVLGQPVQLEVVILKVIRPLPGGHEGSP